MDLTKYLDFAINFLTIIAARTKSTLDDSLLSLLQAIKDSPQMLAFLQTLFDALKPHAHETIDPQDPALISAFEASPAMKSWELRRKRTHGEDAGDPNKEKLGIAGIAGLLKYLPILIELYKAWKNSGLGLPKTAAGA